MAAELAEASKPQPHRRRPQSTSSTGRNTLSINFANS